MKAFLVSVTLCTFLISCTNETRDHELPGPLKPLDTYTTMQPLQFARILTNFVEACPNPLGGSFVDFRAPWAWSDHIHFTLPAGAANSVGGEYDVWRTGDISKIHAVGTVSAFVISNSVDPYEGGNLFFSQIIQRFQAGRCH